MTRVTFCQLPWHIECCKYSGRIVCVFWTTTFNIIQNIYGPIWDGDNQQIYATKRRHRICSHDIDTGDNFAFRRHCALHLLASRASLAILSRLLMWTSLVVDKTNKHVGAYAAIAERFHDDCNGGAASWSDHVLSRCHPAGTLANFRTILLLATKRF